MLAAAIALCAVTSGLASAFFLASLAKVSLWREAHPLVIWALPLGATVVGVLYATKAKRAQGAMSKILSELADPSTRSVSWVIAPAVLLGTLVTHLVGASAGREGTAVQMSSAIGAELSNRLKLSDSAHKLLLTAGIAAGFASVFGTPWAGALYAIELSRTSGLAIKRGIVAVCAAFVADWVARSVGAQHSAFQRITSVGGEPSDWAKLAIFAVIIALTVRAYVWLTHGIKSLVTRVTNREWLRPAIGALLLIAGWQLVGDRFLGLGITTIEQSLHNPHSVAWWWPLAKLIFTAVTIGAGYIGGEVTPLFFVGATLGAVLSPTVHLEPMLGAAIGMVAVFGAAANTPIAMAVMCAEIFGIPVFLQALWVCTIAFILSPAVGIYTPQPASRLKLEHWVRHRFQAKIATESSANAQ